ncbi:MAG: bifunctional helix-turn-helix transcriptional regulator/GNAT family N-acetyltransferase [Haliscomenobacter sp.]|uniref:bifunctional helix-turn-helix transcriptional regulator/GNAT family N-acetyltransferase n=1 Tax=Haliscomenobacter sp. TaxID=2717303 RepID=UPI0029A626DE|nr:bifunctional helix-turn-helix transcriptional regulator/GNAT family N-acetyltransferase [Haliscomenobacter sp.]MDX2069944.1 bifunctional helix-turn-helix transcriptional regulator/GNAT family N-acetyltransferase [Haliscomenobacter sp.]
MSFFEQTGKKAIGTRLRRLSEWITEDAAQIYTLYGVTLQPKWFPVYYVLSGGEAKTITSIAEEIEHSHVSVSKIIREMAKSGLITFGSDENDARKNLVSLSELGLAINAKIAPQFEDVGNAIEAIMAQSNHDLWKAIEEWEFLLSQKSLLQRVIEQRKARESQAVKIVDYTPVYQQAFRDLNVEWISKYFKMEPADYQALDHPQSYILDKGGHILVALYQGQPVGVCALIKKDHPVFDYELGKMAVSPAAQGKSIGFLLGKAILDKARELGARNVFLESNTLLKPAINLYYKLGFEKISGYPSPYERSNIQMMVEL